MRLSKWPWQTFKEIPNDAEIPSHQLMLRAGLIQKVASGLYVYLPMGLKVIQKVEKIVREELDRAGCVELAVPVVTSGELWKESGRWDVFGPDMLKMRDRGGRDLCLSPTNEEAVVDVFRKIVKSYKQLPLTLYQINTKFRDEIRPRYGVMRGREFTMKDAYSFHIDKSSMDTTYDELFKVYEKIFNKIGLKYIAVEADGGSMAEGDSKTHEFQVLANSGEDKVIKCSKCDYAANIEKADTTRFKSIKKKSDSKIEEVVLVETPDMATIEEVSTFLKVDSSICLKSVVYMATTGDKEEHVLALLLGDDDLNEVKLKAYLGCDFLKVASDFNMEEAGLLKGFIGPYKLNSKLPVKVIYDLEVDLEASYVTGGNVVDTHYKNFIPERELKATSESINQVSLRVSKESDSCPLCSSEVTEIRGVEVGHIFQLGDKYTKSMNVTVLNDNGKACYPLMGCYGLGITRTVAAAIEQGHDDDGIVWPNAIAPYDLYFVLIGKSDEIKTLADEIYEELLRSGIETIYDDRKVGPGFKFKDADLLGLPLRVVLGERDYVKDGFVEIKDRKTKKSKKVTRDSIVSVVKEMLGRK